MQPESQVSLQVVTGPEMLDGSRLNFAPATLTPGSSTLPTRLYHRCSSAGTNRYVFCVVSRYVYVSTNHPIFPACPSSWILPELNVQFSSSRTESRGHSTDQHFLPWSPLMPSRTLFHLDVPECALILSRCSRTNRYVHWRVSFCLPFI